MTELLLITDIPRLRQIFSRLSDISDINLHVSTSLESGAKEIAAEKPVIVFVQTHLSGFSAEILLMHLKKQLGRRRTRFVLLCTKGQVSEEVLNQYHGYIDTSLDDDLLFDAIVDSVTSAKHLPRNDILTSPFLQNEATETPATKALEPEPPVQLQKDLSHPGDQHLEHPVVASQPEPSLEDQGAIYSPRTPLSVYSEFTSSFDNAVSSMPPKEPPSGQTHWQDELHEDAIGIEPTHSRPMWLTFLIWAIPLIAFVIVITLFQQHFSKPKPLDIAPAPTAAPGKSDTQVAPPAAEKPTSPPAVISPIESKPAAARLNKLPEFIPRDNRDKEFSKSNPGWERYKGKKTEYKVFRENGSIKAIQIINRDGNGISQTLMNDLLKQMVNNPKFIPESTENKDGYEIQRGRLAEGLTAVYYRDAGNSKLRAIVVTWK